MFDKYDGSLKHMIVGRKEQRRLQEPDLGDSAMVGELYGVELNTVYIKNKDSDSASDDDTYKPFPVDISGKLWKKVHSKLLKNTTLTAVVEPSIQWSFFRRSQVKEKEYGYFVERQDPQNENSFFQEKHYGNEAIAVAKKDLAHCYNDVLTVCQITGVATNNSIGLPALGTDVGFPREEAAVVAVATILEYIKNNPDAYALIHVFVKKRSEFALYTKLLKGYLAD